MGPDDHTLLQGFAPTWCATAQVLFEHWTHAVRASSVVENWHSIVRPHLAVHRVLHEGLSPLQRSQDHAVQVDWLTALGYLPRAA